MMPSPFIVRPLSASEVPLAQELRSRVWRHEVGKAVGPDRMTDDLDNQGVHFGVFVQGELVACARLTFHRTLGEVPDGDLLAPMLKDGPFAMLSRMVVHPEHRGKGYARALDEARFAWAKEHGVNRLLVAATKRRVGALQAEGFRLVLRFTESAAQFQTMELTWMIAELQ
jgi:GNAT superfamily N-acetyltransferase